MACCVTICCRASLGRAVRLAFTPCLGCVHVGYLGLNGATRGIGSIMCGADITPGVLFQMTRWWSLGVIFNTCFVVGFRDFMMGLALVSCGIVMMGVSSITLCSSSRASCCLSLSTLYSSGVGGGVNRLSIQVPRMLSKCLPLGVVFASSVCSVNSSVKACRCWWGVNAGNWQCCRNNSINPEIR